MQRWRRSCGRIPIADRQAKEAMHSTHGAALRPVVYSLDLGGIHSDASHGDDVAEVADGVNAERALGPLHKEAVVAQEGEDVVEVSKVVCPAGAVD